MITNFTQVKEEVLGMYEEFLELVEKAELSPEDKSLKALKTQAETIKKDRFLLMVAGEAKSGKSTFINAFLGKEILPMDVKQCTSALVEIKYGEEISLRANYADGRTKYVKEEEAIKDFLMENAALNDDYRAIPVTTINNEIFLKYKNNIAERVIKDFIDGVQPENIYKLSDEEYEKKIRSYIKENKDKWKDIVTKMVLTYPFKDKSLKGIEIIDSPGVNALGRVGDITNEYIKNAHAIMFLKPITGAALASSSFNNFLNTASVDRNKKALFLILTRAANENRDNLKRLQGGALDLYKSYIEEDHIICVDSKVELFIKNISGMYVEEIEAHLKELREKEQLDDFIKPPWEMKDIHKEEYIGILGKKSNFGEVNEKLNIFGRKSHYLALSELLERMIKVYIKMQKNLEEEIVYANLKIAQPNN